jgi:hypothetical protein
VLQAGRSCVRFLVRSLDVSMDLIVPAALWALGSTQPLTEISTGIFLGVKDGWPPRKADKLTAIYNDCLENVRASMSHNAMGLDGLLQEISLLFYFMIYVFLQRCQISCMFLCL